MRAAVRLAHRKDLRFEQIGAALDPRVEAAAQRTAAACPTYRWLDALAPAATRQAIRRAHLLVNCSVMEGGAQVVVEARAAAPRCSRRASPATSACSGPVMRGSSRSAMMQVSRASSSGPPTRRSS